MKQTRILLTGATGFIGRQILRALKQQGAYVRVVSRQSTPDIQADDYVQTPDLFAEKPNWWKSPIDGIDTVIHAAWYVEPGKYLQSPENAHCLKGSLRLAEAFVESYTKHFTGLGTCFEYDLSHGVLSAETPLKPASPYARAKVDLYKALSQILPTAGKTFGWCRLFYLYGENEKPKRLVSHLHNQLSQGQRVELTSGEEIKDFLDVAVAGDLIAKAAIEKITGPLNICSGTPVTVREIAEKIADQYGRRDLLDFGARQSNPLDPPKIVGVPNT